MSITYQELEKTWWEDFSQNVTLQASKKFNFDEMKRIIFSGDFHNIFAEEELYMAVTGPGTVQAAVAFLSPGIFRNKEYKKYALWRN